MLTQPHPSLFIRPPPSAFSKPRIEVGASSTTSSHSAIDVAESEYRARVQRNFRKDDQVAGTTVDGPGFAPSLVSRTSNTSSSKASSHSDVTVDPPARLPVVPKASSTPVDQYTVDTPAPLPTYPKKADIVEETVDVPRYPSDDKKSKMSYYDDDSK